jgi:hypothetical protein
MLVVSLSHKLKSAEFFIKKIYYSKIGFLKVLLTSKRNIKLPLAKTTECIVLGNGPSLNESINKYHDIIKRGTLFCVNNFSQTECFELYKPENYVMLDQAFFNQKYNPVVIDTFKALKNKTDWNLNLFVPYLYRNDIDLKDISVNYKKINIVFYNYTIMKGFQNIAHFFYKRNLAMPQFYNVLGATVFLAVNSGYKSIYIIGADHTWSDGLYIDDNNSLLRKNIHFYSNVETVQYTPMINNLTHEAQKIGGLFSVLGRIFNSYYTLGDYAKHVGAKIYNASEFSYIDAFERKKF